MKKHSRRFRSALEKLGTVSAVTVEEAIDNLKKLPGARFDETVDVVVKLGIDPRQSNQQVRGAFSLPHGIGKALRVVAFAEGDDAKAAEEAGAVAVGGEDLVKRIQGGWMDFDVAIAHPKLMRHVGKLGRILGPQGKMPSPKSGTVTDRVAEGVAEFRAGKIEFRNDAGGNIHAAVGKKSFEAKMLAENIQAFIDHIRSLKPATSKGVYMQKCVVSSTMGPGIPVSLS